MDHDGEIVEVPLGVEFYAFIYNLLLTSTSNANNSTSTSRSKYGLCWQKIKIFGNVRVEYSQLGHFMHRYIFFH